MRNIFIYILLLSVDISFCLPKLNEILYDPEGADSGKEWIEIYNNGTQSVNLKNWIIQSAGTEFQTEGILPEFILEPSQFCLIGDSLVKDCDIFMKLSLQNGGSASDGVRILSPDSSYFDTIIYDKPNTNNLPDDKSDPAEIFAPDVSRGESLARIYDGDDANNNAEDWFCCQNPTPGLPNVYPTDLKLSPLKIEIFPEKAKFSTYIVNLSTVNVDNSGFSVHFSANTGFEETFVQNNLEAGDSVKAVFSFTKPDIPYLYADAFLEFSNDPVSENNQTSASVFLEDSPVLINEVMFKPESDQTEWIELFNRSDADIDLDNFFVRDASGAKITCKKKILSLDYLILCPDSALTLDRYPHIYPHQITETDDWTYLNNSAEKLILSDTNNSVSDSISYLISSWESGISLERISTENDIFQGVACIDPDGATPAKENSAQNLSPDLSISVKSTEITDTYLTFDLCIKNLSTFPVHNVSPKIKSLYQNNIYEYGLDVLPAPKDSILLNLKFENPGAIEEIAFQIINEGDLNPGNNSDTIAVSVSPFATAINEISANPPEDQPEWFEIYNRSGENLEFTATVRDRVSRSRPFKLNLAVGEFKVVASEKEALLSQYPHLSEKMIQEYEKPISFNNSDDNIYLDLYYSDENIDSVYYEQKPSSYGRSLERNRPDSQTEYCFLPSENPNSATPGFINSIVPPSFNLTFAEATPHFGENYCYLKIRNTGLEKINDFVLTAKIFDPEETDYIESGVFSLKDSAELKTELPQAEEGEYLKVLFELNAEEDEDLSDNRKTVFIGNNSYPATINEIMSNPKKDFPEWLEIKRCNNFYYPDTLQIIIKNDTCRVVLPREKLCLITGNDSDKKKLSSLFNLPENLILTGLPALPNGGASILVSDKFSNIFDDFIYSESTEKGISLERIISDSAPDFTNWGNCINPEGSTPLAENSIMLESVPSEKYINISPNPFSPSKGEHACISLAFPEKTIKTDCKIFDLKGRLIRNLRHEAPSASVSNIIWDGKDDSGKTVALGLYIINIKAVNRFGKTYEKTKTVAAGK
ncbi:MAG: hypothetical protein CSB55_03805 [Candidatus Cloacimonadota bacterium]|nr:MAG: hypothetical protein CSB55_03805 [Candidatus Cloacimonadota bacterium]